MIGAFLTGTTRVNSASKMVTGMNNLGKNTYDLIHYSDLVAVIKNDQSLELLNISDWTNISQYDVIYVHGVSNEELRSVIAVYLRNNSIPFVNTEVFATQYVNKIMQYVAFSTNNLPIPDTYAGSSRALRAYYCKHLKDTKCIVKAASGSNGGDNYVILNEADFSQCSQDVVYVLQPFIPNDYDLRIIVTGDQIALIRKRSHLQSSHLNNVAQGAAIEDLSTVDPEIIAIAIAASKSVKREISGVDILIECETKKPYLLESNFNFALSKSNEIPESFFCKIDKFLQQQAKKELL